MYIHSAIKDVVYTHKCTCTCTCTCHTHVYIVPVVWSEGPCLAGLTSAASGSSLSPTSPASAPPPSSQHCPQHCAASPAAGGQPPHDGAAPPGMCAGQDLPVVYEREGGRDGAREGWSEGGMEGEGWSEGGRGKPREGKERKNDRGWRKRDE